LLIREGGLEAVQVADALLELRLLRASPVDLLELVDVVQGGPVVLAGARVARRREPPQDAHVTPDGVQTHLGLLAREADVVLPHQVHDFLGGPPLSLAEQVVLSPILLV